MFKVTPIGSCRITAPLRYGQSDYGIQLNQNRCYGYCHSPAEALQMARFLQGNADIHDGIWPLISRSHDLTEISADTHTPSDLYVIELASAKEVTIDGISIQLNYLNAAYSDFFSDTKRARTFWACAEQGSEPDMFEFLNQTWSDTDDQKQQATVLGKIRLRFVTHESLRHNIQQLSQILPDVLFVSHIDACKTDGKTIKSRSSFVQMVQQEVQLAGCKFYNPTELMAKFGQSAAIEDESTSLAHFTKVFSDAVMDDWMRRFIAPKTDNSVCSDPKGALEDQLSPQITAAIQAGRFSDTRFRLEALSQKADYIQPYLTQLEQQEKDAQSVFNDTLENSISINLDADKRDQLILQAGALGLYDVALDLVTQTPGGFQSLPAHTLLRIADQACKARDTDNAFEFFLAAVRQNQDLSCARTSLIQLALNEEIDLLAELEPDQFTNFMSQLQPIEKLELLRLNGASFSAAISSKTTTKEIGDIASYLTENYGLEQGITVLSDWCEQKQIDRIHDQTLRDIIDQWVITALSATDRVKRIQMLNMVLQAAPKHQGIRNAMRDIRMELAIRIRAAGKSADIDALNDMTDEVATLNTELPEFDLWRARLKFRLGEYATAMELAQSAVISLPEKINVWVLLMRAADKAENAAKATESAHKVIELTCAKTEKLKSEAEAVLRSSLATV